MSQINKESVAKSLALIAAKISEFDTTMRTAMATIENLQKTVETNNQKMDTLERNLTGEIESLKSTIRLQKVELSSFRREIECSRLVEPSINNTSNLRCALVRNIIHPVAVSKKDKVARKKQFSWGLYKNLIQGYRRSIGLHHASEDENAAAIENIKPAIYAVIASAKERMKKENGVDQTQDLKWSHVPKNVRIHMYKQLEEFGNEEVPLSSCVAYWGARLILAKYWNNAKESQRIDDDQSDLESQESFEDIKDKDNKKNEIEESEEEISDDILLGLKKACSLDNDKDNWEEQDDWVNQEVYHMQDEENKEDEEKLILKRKRLQ